MIRMDFPPASLSRMTLLSAALLGATWQPIAQAQDVSTTPPAVTTTPVTTPAVDVPASTPTPVVTTVPASTTVIVTPSSNPFTLEQALTQLGAAPAVQQANLALERAGRDLDAARAALNLNVTVGGNNVNYTSAPATGANNLTGTLYTRATAGLLPWATNQSALATAQQALNYAKAVRQENINVTRLNVIQQYQQGYLAQLQLTAAQQNLQSAQQTLAAAQAQRNLQNTTQENLLQAQSGLQLAQAGVLTAQNALDTARRSLAASLGLGSSLDNVTFTTPPQLPANLDVTGLTALGLGDVNALVSRAIAASSAVVEAQNNLLTAQRLLADQQRNLVLPSLTVGAMYGKNGSGATAGLDLQAGTVYAGYNQSFGMAGNATSNSLSVSLNGSYSFYNPSGRAQIASTQAQVTQTQLSLILARQTVELSVRQKYSDTLTALGAVASKVTLEERARVALQTAQARLGAGIATQNDVLSAQAAYAQAQQDTQAARAAASVAVIQLQNLAGGAS